jgi:hypothetical protein
MIEAVNSTVASAALLRGNTEQVSVARSLAANPEKTQEAAPAPQAPFVSPYIYVDVNYNKAVLQIRDSDTGDVLKQFPSETTLRAQLQQQSNQQAAEFIHQSAQVQQPIPAPEQQVAAAPAPAPQATQQPVAQAQVAAAALTKAAQTSAQPATVVTSA